MKLHNLKKTLLASALGLVTILGTGGDADAQTRRQVEKQQQKVERQQQRVQNQRAKLEAQRIRLEQQRLEQIRLQNQRNRGNVYSNNDRYNNNRNSNNRYRVYRNGSYYQTDDRGAELLRQAVNRGYQQGVRAGQADRSGRRQGRYDNNSIYRSGNYGYESYVDSSQYQYYFQQGFERGYQDGYNSRYQNGSNNNGTFNILGTILQGILNFQQF